MFNKIIKNILYLSFLSVAVLLLLELSYRFYIIDFYKGNLIGLNDATSLKNEEKETILIVGDSFTAAQNSYVNHLRAGAKDYRFINAALGGTSIPHHKILAPSRIKAFDPDVFIYQIYVGNDLFEFEHPIDSPAISYSRKIYWWLSDRFLALSFLNKKLSFLKDNQLTDVKNDTDPKRLNDYKKENYNSRTKLNFSVEPNYLEQSILLKGRQRKNMEQYSKQVGKMLTNLPDGCKIIVLVMPHCIQLNQKYMNRMFEMGAKVENEAEIREVNYPFIEYLKNRFQGREILFINALEVLRQADEKAPVYYNNDPHLNSYGHEVIGGYLLGKLKY